MLPDLVHTRRGPSASDGTGTPVVLLHGIGHRRQAWDPVLDRLAERYDVIAVDLSGFGESPAFPRGHAYSMANACDHLVQQFEQWGIEKPHVVGNSLGGAIALELGARGAVASVTALSPAGFFGRLDRFQALVALMFLRVVAVISPDAVLRAVSRTELGRRVVGWSLYAHPERHDADDTLGDSLALKHATAFERTAVNALRYRFDHPIPVPTTVAWGTRDRILPYKQSKLARRRLPHARHEELLGSGHVPMADDPDRIITLVDETVGRATGLHRAA